MLPADFWETEERYLLAVLVDALTQAAIDGAQLAFGFSNELANSRAAQWARQHTDDLLQLLGTTSQRVVGERIEEWVRRPGSTIGELVTSIKEGMSTSDTRASTIAVTEITRAYAAGNRIGFEQAGVTDWRWQTNNDELVCPVCGPLNQVIKSIGDVFGVFNGRPFTQPPAHPNCRCWMTPVVKTDRPLRPRPPAPDAIAPIPQAAEPEPPKPGTFQNMLQVEDWIEDHPNFDWDLEGVKGIEQANRVLSEISTIIEKHPQIQFDMVKAHVDAVLPTLRQFDHLSERWPEVAKRLRYIGTYEGGNSILPFYPWEKRVHAHASRDSLRIGLNPRYYGDPKMFKASLDDGERTGWSPPGCNSIEYVFTHEFGHQVDNWLGTSHDVFVDYGVVDTDGFGIVLETLGLWRSNNKATRKLSRYALYTEQEGFAEAFASLEHSPRKRKTLFTRRLETLLNEIGDPKKWRSSSVVNWYLDSSMQDRPVLRQKINEAKKKLNVRIF